MADTRDWLIYRNLTVFVPKFKSEEIDGMFLASLTAEKIAEHFGGVNNIQLEKLWLRIKAFT